MKNKFIQKVTAGVVTVALAAFCIPAGMAVADSQWVNGSTDGPTYQAPVDTSMSLTYGDEIVLTSTYVTTSQLTGPLTAAWSCDKFAFDKTTSAVKETKQVQANPDGTTTDYFIYVATIGAKAISAGDSVAWSQINGNPAKINGVDGVAVKVAKKRIDVPTADKTVFVYQKDLKQYPQFAENEAYKVIIPESVKVGDYVAGLQLNDKTNTEWNLVDDKGEALHKTDDQAVKYYIVERDYASELEAANATIEKLNGKVTNLEGQVTKLNDDVAKAKNVKPTLKKGLSFKYKGKTYTVKSTSKSGKTFIVKVK